MRLSAPQNIFLNGLDTKYRAYVGGYGCVHPDTKIHTEYGLMRIFDIDRPMRVLSWNEKNQQFQLSLTGGSFPKGKANLYRTVTQHGEFVSSGHHRSFSSSHEYVRSDSLSVGHELSSYGSNLPLSSLVSYLLELPEDAQHCSKTIVNLMGNYADEARQYGQQLLKGLNSDQSSFPLRDDVQELSHDDGLSVFLRKGDYKGQKQLHNRHDQYVYPSCTSHLKNQSQNQSFGEVDHTSALSVVRTSGYHSPSQQFERTFSHHHNTGQRSFVGHSLNIHSLSKTKILSHTQDAEQSEYWDMQVLNTNNYVDEFGHIHHNSGKSFVGCLDLLIFFSKHPKTVQGYFGPTYPSIRDIFYPTFEEAAHLMGFTVKVITSNKEVHVYRNGQYYGTVICRSMDNPSSIVGYKVSRCLVDELDTLAKDKAKAVWDKIIARLRLVIDGVENSVGVTTTPEGYLFVYDTFANEPSKSYSMVQASTYENAAYLPPDYIDTLYETYSQELANAYINGEFVNLTAGSVYRNYDKIRCRSSEEIKGNERLYIGQDFNVNKMASCIAVKRGDDFHFVDELVDLQDTPHLIETIKEKWPDNPVTIYPDSSGKNTSSKNASVSDIGMLEDYFNVRYRSTNPRIKDRVLSVNTAFSKGRLFVNDRLCPETSKCLEQQAYDKNGEPDKSAGHDHTTDALGYMVAYEMPVNKPVVQSIAVTGLY